MFDRLLPRAEIAMGRLARRMEVSMHPILRGMILRAVIVGLALLACSGVRAEDPVIPGLKMDAVSTRTVEAWR